MNLNNKPYKGQKYSALKKDCVKKGNLFIDPEFPPNNKSLFFSKVDSAIEWKRPKVRYFTDTLRGRVLICYIDYYSTF